MHTQIKIILRVCMLHRSKHYLFATTCFNLFILFHHILSISLTINVIKFSLKYFQGRTFAKIINEFVDCYKPLNETYLAAYSTEEGKKVYDETLECVKKQFPQYVREIEGTAAGANVPFYKVRFHVSLFFITIITIKIKYNIS